ncbi:M56 family metallopeptidase [Streptomyces reniochalinae]|uniref:M56 family peptidase n=1 Tax=Streptomyces reniochalinae TaxID=2250578 RepID=A0A367F619_9ACTN|nr:M56 family metallopeptidase [Streptomyces reniochalinae]RCG25804.1 M56 family peptidase [Streptomyces reniochalinae]
MGFFVLLPLVLPLTSWPVARLAERRLHPRATTRLLVAAGVVLAACSTLCLGLLVVVGTAQLPGNPLPDAWSHPQVRAAVPYDEILGKAAIPALLALVTAGGVTVARHLRVRRRVRRALGGLPPSPVAVLPDSEPYAFALPGNRRTRARVVVTTSLLDALEPAERRALFAHERAHLTARHPLLLLLAELAAVANPFLRPLRTAVTFGVERWADEEAARIVGDRRMTARAVGKAALIARNGPPRSLPALAGAGQVPRRVQALLAPPPTARLWLPPTTAPGLVAGLAAWLAALGAALSALSSANAAVALVVILQAATPL